MADEIGSIKIVIDAEDKATAVFNNVSKNAKKFGDELDGVTKPLQKTALGTLAAGAAAVKASMDYETAFTGVKKTVDGTPEQLKAVDSGLKQLSKTIPVSAKNLAGLAATGGQLGVATDDILKFTETMAAMGVATNLAGEEGAAALAKYINVSGESMKNIDRVGSSIVELGNNTATTEADIAHMAVRMAKFGKTVGMNSHQTLGYSAALSSMGIEAQAGGSAIGRVWMEIETAVSNGGDALKEYAKYAGKSSQEFAKQWSDDPSGAFAGLVKGLSTTKNITKALDEIGVSQTLDKTAVLALVNNYELLEKCLNLSSEAYKENTALNKEANAAYGTTANQLQLTMNEITNAGMKWGDILLPEIKSGAQWVGGLAENFGNLDEGTKKAVISSGKMVIGFGAAAKSAVILSKGIGAVSALGAALGPVGLTAAGIAAAGKLAYDAYKNLDVNYSKNLSDTAEKAAEAAEKYKEIYDLRKEYNELQGKVTNGESNIDEIEKAKNRIEEIKKILSDKFKLDVDTSDIDNAFEKLSAAAEYEMITQRSELIAGLGAYDDGEYGKLQSSIKDGGRTLSQYSDQMTQINKAETAIEKLSDDWERLTAEEKRSLDVQTKFKKELNDAAHAGGIDPKIEYDYNAFGTVLEALGDKYQDLEAKSKKLRKEIAKNAETAGNIKMSAEKLAQVGIAEIKTGDTERGFEDISLAVEKANLSIDEYAKKAALAQSGNNSFKEIFDTVPNDGGAGLNNFVSQYVQNMQRFGAAAEDTAVGAGLLKNGFENLGQLKGQTAESIQTVTNDINCMADSIGGIEGKTIGIDVDSGSIETIDDVSGKIERIENESVTVSVGADGNVDILDKASGMMQMLQGIGAVSVQLNAEGNIEVLDEAKEKLAEINPKTCDVTFKTDETAVNEYIEEEKKATVKYHYDESEIIKYQPEPKHANVLFHPVMAEAKRQANGTKYFSGGLAMVNDQSGISDPRELIIDKGNAFIPEGRNVVLPLSRGAKVYTASQTKEIMSALGIPQYAKGKKNNTAKISDAYSNAKASLQHSTKIKAVEVTDELEKWVELSKKFKKNIKDAEDIEENIYSVTLKVRQEMNQASEKYLLERAGMNDWESWGDSAVEAFGRVRTRENKAVAEGKILASEANNYLTGLGEQMFDTRIKNSQNWLEHEIKYNNMSVTGYIEGLDRMRAYTEEYYALGIIDAQKYYETIGTISDRKTDKTKEGNENEVNAWIKESEAWYDDRSFYGDWEKYGDSEEAFYERSIGRIKDFYAAGKIEWDQYYEMLKEAQKNLYSAREKAKENEVDAWIKDRDAWNTERSFYDDWEEFGDSETAFYKRSIGKIESFYNAGKMEWDKYYEMKKEAQRNLYSVQEKDFDNMLNSYSKYIDGVNSEYDKLINKKNEAYDMDKLKGDLSKAKEQRDIYANAVTQRGKDVYDSAVESINSLNHEIEIKNLQKKQTETVEALRKDYEIMENGKKEWLKASVNAQIDIKSLSNNIIFNQSGIAEIMGDILKCIKNMNPIQTTYGDTNLTINSGNSGIDDLARYWTAGAASGFNGR